MNTRSLSSNPEAGFSLIELLVVIIMVGVLAAIAVPSWLAFVNQQRLNSAKRQALTVLRDAQSNAQREKLRWQVCFKDDGNQVLYTAHRVPSDNNCLVTNWEPLIGEDSKAIKVLTSTMSTSPNGFYRMQFNYDGSVEKEGTQPWRITFSPRINSGSKTCATVETLLGSISTGQDNKCTI
ncbi:type II secretion system protein [Iningainema tapete]|uniref:Type II secretion system protein n=1 Tax=Iningainema tapete BLCC-T55 TaxID=2748662 RepID=A0A8J6XF10_9CYAN|nr:type II secretion system protein [Iningainema tapete]MBD2771462.1 type II secretion system protein [Iningainema tapete BLCC-T55]